MSAKIKLTSLFTLTSPLHVSEPGGSYYDPTTRTWASSNRGGGFPTRRTKAMPVATIAGGDAEAASGENAERTRNRLVPYYPANSFRGALRRHAAELIHDALKKRDELISLELYHIMMCGAANGSGGSSATISEAIAAAADPFASVFGGGPKFVWSRLSVGNAFAVTPSTIAAGLVPSDHGEDSAAAEWVTAVAMDSRVDDIMRSQRGLPSVLRSPEESIQAWIEALDDSREKRDAGDTDSKKLGVAGVQGTEYVIPGTRLYASHILDTSFAGPAALGLLACALAAFANAQRIGGCSRVGFGRFLLSVTAQNGTGGSFPLLTESNGQYAPNLGADVVATAVGAWNEYLATVTAAQLTKVWSLDSVRTAKSGKRGKKEAKPEPAEGAE